MIENIHKWLLLRLALLWLVLSIVIGGMVNYLGNVRMDNHIVEMAKTETSSYIAAIDSYLKSPSELALSELNSKIGAEIIRDNLIAVEFYSVDSNMITDAVKLHAKEIEAKLPEHGSEFVDKDGTVCNKLMIENDTYMRVFVPLFNSAGTKIAYLEGIYHAPGDIVKEIKRQTLWALILVVLLISATSLALYPLILRLNRKLINYSKSLALTNIGMLKVLGSAISKGTVTPIYITIGLRSIQSISAKGWDFHRARCRG